LGRPKGEDPPPGEENPEKSGSLINAQGGRNPVSCFKLIDAEKASYPVAVLCKMLRVSRSDY
jgi:hypothetical protein